MSEITLYNNSSARMTIMALGKAVEWTPKTTMIVSKEEAEKLLKGYNHIIKYEDLATNSSELVSFLNKEIEELKAKNSALEKELTELKNEPKAKKGK